MKKFDFKKYVEFKVYSVTTIKKGYGFRVLLKFADGSDTTQQHAGFCSKREANAQRDEIIGQLHAGTYIVYGKIKVADFMEFWLEEIMRPRIADNSYNGYKNVVYNYVNPQLGKMYMATLNQGYIRKLYNSIAEKYESIARLAKTVMNTALDYAKSKNVIAVNPAEGVPLPKKIKKKPYREVKDRCKQDSDAPAGISVGRGEQSDADPYADLICSSDGPAAWRNQRTEIQ